MGLRGWRVNIPAIDADRRGAHETKLLGLFICLDPCDFYLAPDALFIHHLTQAVKRRLVGRAVFIIKKFYSQHSFTPSSEIISTAYPQVKM